MPVILLNTYLNFQVEFMIKSGLKIFITLLSYSWLILYTDRYRYINKVIHFCIAKVSARTGRTIVPALLIRLQYFIESKRGGINVNNRAATTNIGWTTKIKKEREKKKGGSRLPDLSFIASNKLLWTTTSSSSAIIGNKVKAFTSHFQRTQRKVVYKNKS